MINWEQYDKEQAEERALKEGFSSVDYTGINCKNCGRNRVMNCKNGRHVCEKCGWDSDMNDYSEYLSL